jgi:hypothetical protein
MKLGEGIKKDQGIKGSKGRKGRKGRKGGVFINR